jgi:hydroxyethylthiazole kinase
MVTMTLTPSDIGHQLTAVRNTAPLVQCITNAVVMNFTANVLLATGAAPAMTDVPGEAGPFTRIASALLINLGTPYAEQRAAIVESVPVAIETGVPWVLDPVAVGSLPIRTGLAADLLTRNPTAIRGNPSEIIALAGAGPGGRGVDAVDSPDDAMDAAHELASRHHSVVAVSGKTDVVTDGQTDLRLRNGDERLTAITGGGCALGALTGAFLAVSPSNPLHAVAAATAVYTIAAEVAADGAPGPGTFAVRLLDALSDLDQSTIEARLVVA